MTGKRAESAEATGWRGVSLDAAAAVAAAAATATHCTHQLLVLNARFRTGEADEELRQLPRELRDACQAYNHCYCCCTVTPQDVTCCTAVQVAAANSRQHHYCDCCCL